MHVVVGRVIPQRVVEGEPDVVGEGLVRGVPSRDEVLLDGAEIHGAPDDSAVVVQLEALDVDGGVEPHAVLRLAQPHQDLPAPLPHRLHQRGRRGRRPRVGLRGGGTAAALLAVLPRVDAGEERADAAELAGEPRAELPRLGRGHFRRPELDVPRGGRLRLRDGQRRRRLRRRRPAAGDRDAAPRARAVVAPRVRVGRWLGHEGDAGAAPVAVVRVRVVDLIPAGEHRGGHRRLRRAAARDLTAPGGASVASLRGPGLRGLFGWVRAGPACERVGLR